MKNLLIFILLNISVCFTGVSPVYSLDVEQLSTSTASCRYEKISIDDMISARCNGLKLERLPKNLRTDIEVLNFNDNKLRRLNAETFASFTYIRFLYLSDNSIYIIEPSTFQPLAYLETLDLSKNALQTIPMTILNLPSLRRLSLDGNALENLPRDLEQIKKPIKAPLEYLSLSESSITSLPDFGILPSLKVYNLTNVQLNYISVVDVIKTCGLMELHFIDSTRNLDKCSLKSVMEWLQDHEVYVNPSIDSSNTPGFGECKTKAIDNSTQMIYNICKSTTVAKVVYHKPLRVDKWIVISGSLAAFFILFMMLLYIMHLRDVRKMKQINKCTMPNEAKSKHSLSKLLNDNNV